MGDPDSLMLSQKDAAELSAMLKWFKKHVHGEKSRSPLPDLPQAPEVYIAKVPSGGIAAYGTPSGTDSGSDIADAHYARCRLYWIRHTTDTDVDTMPLGVDEDVWNLGTAPIPADTIVLAVRDKAGKFIAVSVDNGDGGKWIKLIEEGLGLYSYQGYYSWVEMVEDGEGGFEELSGGTSGLYTENAARDSSFKEAVPLEIVVRARPGMSISGTAIDRFMWFTTPDLDQDILCLESSSSGTGTVNDWATAVITKYNPLQRRWHDKGSVYLMHMNDRLLYTGVRYRGHFCGYTVSGIPLYTTSDCCVSYPVAIVDPGTSEVPDDTNPDTAIPYPPPTYTNACNSSGTIPDILYAHFGSSVAPMTFQAAGVACGTIPGGSLPYPGWCGLLTLPGRPEVSVWLFLDCVAPTVNNLLRYDCTTGSSGSVSVAAYTTTPPFVITNIPLFCGFSTFNITINTTP